MSASASASEAHQQKIDEILSIYIQSDIMTGRKSNNLNLKISTSNNKHGKPPRSVPVKLKSQEPLKPPVGVSIPVQVQNSSSATLNPHPHSNSHSHGTKIRRNSSAATVNVNPNSSSNSSTKTNSKVTFQTPHSTHNNSNSDRPPPPHHSSSSSAHPPLTHSQSFSHSHGQSQSYSEQFSEMLLFHSLRNSPISETDEEKFLNEQSDETESPQNGNEKERERQFISKSSGSGSRSLSNSPLKEPSPQSPISSPKQKQQRPKSPKSESRIPETKESYARILATLKRIEDEEKLNYDLPLTTTMGKGDCEPKSKSNHNQNQDEDVGDEILEKLRSYPSISAISPPAHYYDHIIPSRPCTPGGSSSTPRIPGAGAGTSNCNGNGNGSYTNESPRKKNSRFTTTSSVQNPPHNFESPRSLSSSRLPLPPLDSPKKPAGTNHEQDLYEYDFDKDGNKSANSNFNANGDLQSARSFQADEPTRLSSCSEYQNQHQNQHQHQQRRPQSVASSIQSPRWEMSTPRNNWETNDEKTKNIFSFLDQVEKSDRETLFNLQLDKSPGGGSGAGGGAGNGSGMDGHQNFGGRQEFTHHTMDSLIRRGSVELAREVILLERKIEESQHNITVLEETLINQRELNMRHIKNSERDLKKRLKLQQEEFELALTRHQAFLDQLISEKRALQEKCEKVLRDLQTLEIKHQDTVKALQEKHLEEIKRLRRMHENSEKARRVKWMGNKTQEIRETTIKGLEPELQRVIQRHQQEMSETRAWHAQELNEMEERCSRKLAKQAAEIRDQMNREKDDAIRRERELVHRHHEGELEHMRQELETQKRRYTNEIHEERERFELEQQKVKDLIQENIRKVEIKAEVEFDSLKETYETKLASQERRHESELKAIANVHEAERENYIASYNKKLEQAITEREIILSQSHKVEKEAEMEEREKKLRSDFEKQWKEQEELYENRLKRLQEKFSSEIQEFEECEKELKLKFSQVKAELIGKEEEIFTLRTTVSLKEKQNSELADSNMKMLEERANLTAVIRREFVVQIESLEQDCMAVKASVIELKSKQRFEQEQHAMELERVRGEKDNELDKVGQRVVQAMARKEETILELQKQLDKASFRINHLEELLEQQRKEFVQSMTCTTSTTTQKNRTHSHKKT